MIGCVGALLANLTSILLYKLKVDDPVGVIPVHGTCAIWGLLAVGKFFLDSNCGIIPKTTWLKYCLRVLCSKYNI